MLDLRLEAVVIPVSDVDRAAAFYRGLGWRVDADLATAGGGRILQFTPPGSACSVLLGTDLTPSAPGTTQFLHLIVRDIEAARADLVGRGVQVGEVFHDAEGGFNRFDPTTRAAGLDPKRRSYASFATFSDPDGNGWLLQEIKTRLPGRGDESVTFRSVADLADALRRAAEAHGEQEERLGAADVNWPDWYAGRMAADQGAGQ